MTAIVHAMGSKGVLPLFGKDFQDSLTEPYRRFLCIDFIETVNPHCSSGLPSEPMSLRLHDCEKNSSS